MGTRAATASALATWTAAEAAAALHAGECSARELLKAATAAMGRTRQLNAFVGGVLSTAAADADASDERRDTSRGRDDARSTPDAGSILDGVPIAVKDNFCVRGAPTTAGSGMLRGYEPPLESTVTSRLRAAGAVIVGKCNMDEFGMGSANVNSASGACINPWVARPAQRPAQSPDGGSIDDRSIARSIDDHRLGPRSAGGSSGGSACAVASGAAILAVGSDTGGSVRLPAAYCGVVGLKPSYGSVSRWGLVPYCSSLDTPGFLARSVSDAAVAMHVTHGSDPLDSTTNSRVDRAKLGRWIDANDDVGKFLTRLEVSGGVSGGMPGRFRRNGGSPFVRSKVGMPLAGWRVGVPVEYDVAECSNEVRAAWSETCELLERLGASVTPVTLPSTAAALAAYYVLAPAEASSNLARYDGVRYGRNGAVNGGYGTARDGELGRRQTTRFKPGTEGVFVASGGREGFHESTASARSRGFGPEVQRRVLVGTYVLGTDVTARYFDRAQRVRRVVSEEFARVFSGGGGGGAGGAGGGSDAFGLSGRARGIAHTGVDLLLTPTAPTVAPLLYGPGGVGEGDQSGFDQSGTGRFAHSAHTTTAGYAADAMTVPASLAGLPAISLPVGLGFESGMPVGMQLIAPRGCDVELVGAAWHVERALADAAANGGGVGPGVTGGDDKDLGRPLIGWGRDHRAQGTVDAVRFSAMGDFV